MHRVINTGYHMRFRNSTTANFERDWSSSAGRIAGLSAIDVARAGMGIPTAKYGNVAESVNWNYVSTVMIFHARKLVRIRLWLS